MFFTANSDTRFLLTNDIEDSKYLTSVYFSSYNAGSSDDRYSTILFYRQKLYLDKKKWSRVGWAFKLLILAEYHLF